MKRKILFCLLSATVVSLRAQPAVDNRKGVLWQFELNSAVPSKSGGVEMSSIQPEIGIGYNFDPRFSLFVPMTGTLGLFESGNARSWDRSLQLGLGFSYAPLHTQHDRLGIGLKAGCTVDGDWKHVYYDCGVRWQSDVLWAPLYVGVGVRYYDSYCGRFEDYCNFYIAVGIRILWRRSPGREPSH